MTIMNGVERATKDADGSLPQPLRREGSANSGEVRALYVRINMGETKFYDKCFLLT